MPAVSGSPTQLATSVDTPAELAGTPDDGFMEGDVASVGSLFPNGNFRLVRRVAPIAPDNVTLIATHTGYGYWLRADIASLSVVQAVAGDPKSETLNVQISTSLTSAAGAAVYEYTPPHDTTLRVYATVQEIKSDGSDDYGVDLCAAYRTDGAGVVTERLASTPAAGTEVAAGVAITQPALTTDGSKVILTAYGHNAEDWRLSANLTFSLRSTAP